MYKRETTIVQRKRETLEIRKKYPNQLPIMCEKNLKDRHAPDISRRKYLVARDLTIGQFIFIIRKKIKLNAEAAIYLCIGNSIPSSAERMGDLYEKNADEDGYLYVTYTMENTFG
jgi:GABA(A) receptor-associated protein